MYGILFGFCGRTIDGPGLPGGLIIYQGHLLYFPEKGRLCSMSAELRRHGAHHFDRNREASFARGDAVLWVNTQDPSTAGKSAKLAPKEPKASERGRSFSPVCWLSWFSLVLFIFGALLFFVLFGA